MGRSLHSATTDLMILASQTPEASWHFEIYVDDAVLSNVSVFFRSQQIELDGY